MAGIIQGLAAICAVVAIGWLLRIRRIMSREVIDALALIVYWVATPALIFRTVSTSPLAGAIGKPLAVAAISGCAVALVFAVMALIFRMQRVERAVATMSSSVTNAAHIGIPVAAYVLGNTSAVAPVIIFQLCFLTPFSFVMIDLAASKQKLSIGLATKMVFSNPMVIAVMLALAVNALQVPIPRLISSLADLVGSAAPAMVLLAFGASLKDMRPKELNWKTVSLVAACKGILHPLLAWTAAMMLGLHGHALLAVTVMAAMPSAQNCFVAATRAKAGEQVAQGGIMVTTALFVPAVVVIAALLT